jgi:hypothetical protein
MQVDFTETHKNCAKGLYRQRTAMLQETNVNVHNLQQLEERLRLHLFAVRQFDPEPEDEPTEAAEAFVYLSTGFLSDNLRANQAAWIFARQWLGEDTPRAGAARDALILFPLPNLMHGIEKAYQEEAGIRPILIYIGDVLGFPLPKGLLNQGELQIQDPALQAQVMRLLASREDTGMDVFRHYYNALVTNPRAQLDNPEVLEYAIWGGMQRGDPDATTALRRAIEIQRDEKLRERLLRLVALSGDPEMYPVLQQTLLKKSEFAYYLLALTGLPQAKDDVLAGLNDPRTADHAARAWYWMTAQNLSKKPRLTVVGDDETQNTSDAESDTVPNPDDALSWYAQHGGIWTDSVRLVHGKPMNPVWLLHLAKNWCGRNGTDYIDLLAMSLARPLAISDHRWEIQRQAQLQEVESMLAGQTITSSSMTIPGSAHA